MPYTGTDIYCDLILTGELPVEIVHETDAVLAFKHTQPHWPVHIVVISKMHISSFIEVKPPYKAVFDELLKVVQLIAKRVTEKHGAARVLTNLGEYQDSKHLHFHVNFGEPIKG